MGTSSCGTCTASSGVENKEITTDGKNQSKRELKSENAMGDPRLQRQMSNKTVKRASTHRSTFMKHIKTSQDDQHGDIHNLQTFTEQNSVKMLCPQISDMSHCAEDIARNFLDQMMPIYLQKAVEILKQQKKKVQIQEPVCTLQVTKRASMINNNMGDSVLKVRVKKDQFVRVLKKNINLQYKFKQKLGEGSFGSVHRAQFIKTGQERAIKIIRKTKDDSLKESLFGELQLLKTMDHPNIIKLFEIYDFKQFYYVVTQYCSGGQLFAAVKKSHHFSEQDAASIMKQLLSAVTYMHKRGIVHRDLKPQNIVFQVKTSGSIKDSRIKIIDFGTAQVIKKGKNLTAKVGSPFYVAPEVLLQNYNIKCDVWSCGIILHVLLSGYPPFRGRTHEEIFASIAKDKLSFEEKMWKNISKDAINLVKAMLDRNVGRRISAEEALNSLWINQCTNSAPIGAQALLNMEKFFFKNKFVAVIETYLATNAISQEERMQLAQKFKSIDKDGSGVIEISQLVQAYKTIYGSVQEDDIAAIIDTIDINGSGKIDFTQFIIATTNRQKLFQRKALEQAFEFFDQDKTGYIELSEIKELLGDSCDNEEMNNIMDELDDNGDKQISKDEFIAKLLPA